MKGDSTLEKAILIGKSMSLCVRDILKGIVSLNQVILIDAGTMVATINDLESLLISYHELYWFEWTLEDASKIVEKLLFTQRLRQSRIAPTHDGSHLKRSLKLHRCIGKGIKSKVELRERLHYDGCFIGQPEFGPHWKIVDIIDDDETKTEGEDNTLSSMDEVVTGLVDELKDIAHGRHEKGWYKLGDVA